MPENHWKKLGHYLSHYFIDEGSWPLKAKTCPESHRVRGWAKSQQSWVPGALPPTVPLPHSLVSELLSHASMWDKRKTQASVPNNLNGRVPRKSNQAKQEKSPEHVCGRSAWTLTLVVTAPIRFSCFKLARKTFIFFNHGLLTYYIVIYDYIVKVQLAYFINTLLKMGKDVGSQ